MLCTADRMVRECPVILIWNQPFLLQNDNGDVYQYHVYYIVRNIIHQLSSERYGTFRLKLHSSEVHL